jgi:hypothetical protein
MLIVAFWVVICGMLIYQIYTYNQGISQAAQNHAPQQFFFLPPSSKKDAPPAPPVVHNGPFVEQTAYSVHENTPSTGSFTCNVTLKNTGKAKAVNVQVAVRPYRGTRTDDEDRGPNVPGVTFLDDNDYRAQVCTWVPFPDLAPGESSTQSVVFLMRSDVRPGPNPNPEIIFEPDKAAKPAPPNPANN